MQKKLLFWLSGDVLHFCLSHYLQKDFGYEIDAIIDVPNKNGSIISYGEGNYSSAVVWRQHE